MKKIQLGLIIVLSLIVLALIFSMSANPSSPYIFNLKRLQEKAFLKITPGIDEKVKYMSSILNNRLAEIQSIVENKNYEHLLKSSLRYSAQIGEITDIISANNLKDKIEPLRTQLNMHKEVLQKLYDSYPKDTGNLEYKYLEDAINYINIYSEKLSEVK